MNTPQTPHPQHDADSHGAGGHADDSGGHHGHLGHHGHRPHKFDPANLERLLGEERRKLLPPERVLDAAGIASGQTVIDLGCGPGYLTLPAAERAGAGGTVYGVDVQAEPLQVCGRRADEAGLRNVQTVLWEARAVPLPDGTADRILVSLVLHETEDPVAFLREARRLLAPEGSIAIVELAKQTGPPGWPSGPRVSPEDVARFAAAAGLVAGVPSPLNEHYYLIALRPRQE
jgi:SAM-dependent methyltransferase